MYQTSRLVNRLRPMVTAAMYRVDGAWISAVGARCVGGESRRSGY